ncbi:MAG: hypothetical protein DMF82_04760 [Acidobacteria bacterium]|nr:MAG: hypothetical protein DMF82_04760 [Acidobacteriota bacterium]
MDRRRSRATDHRDRGAAREEQLPGGAGCARVADRHLPLRTGPVRIFYGHQGELEYDLVIAPGADQRAIALSFEGAALALDDQGDLVLQTSVGPVRLRKPVVYQEVSGVRREIAGGYVLQENRVGFRLGAYDARQPLVIDPVLTYSIDLSVNGFGHDVAVDTLGNAYVTSSDGWNAYVAKLDPSGALVYSTYFGGTGGEVPVSIAVDRAGNAHVTGFTRSRDFPTVNAFQSECAFNVLPIQINCEDAFIMKLNAAGTGLVYSTYVGGTGPIDPYAYGGSDRGVAIAVDPAGNAYVVGSTNSADLRTGFCSLDPPACGFQTSAPSAPFSRDAFVAKIKPNGSFFYLSYLGGSLDDEAFGIAADPAGHAYITGYTQSADFPVTPGAFQTECVHPPSSILCSRTVFVAKVEPLGFALTYGTYLVGSRREEGRDVAADAEGHAYVTGFTESGDFPVTPGALDVDCGTDGDGDCDPDLVFGGFKDDAFVTKLSADGSTLVYSTFLGGSDYDRAGAIAVDEAGQAYVTGRGSIPGSVPLPPTSPDPQGPFVAKLAADGSSLAYSVFLAGAGDSFKGGIAVDTASGVYVAYRSVNRLAECLEDSYVVSASGQTFQSSGGSGTVGVTAPGGCDWAAVSNVSWIAVTAGSAGSGNGTVGYAVASNHGGTRTGTVVMAGRVFTVTQLGIPDIAVTMTDSPDPAFVGDDLVYTVTITDRGPSVATGVVLTDDLPSGVALLSATSSQGRCGWILRRVTCSVGTLASGGVAQVQIVVVPGSAGKYGTTKIVNSASVAAIQPDPNTLNNRAAAVTTISDY